MLDLSQMSRLSERWDLVDWKKIAKWYEDGIAQCGMETIKTNAVNEIRQGFNLCIRPNPKFYL